MATVYLWLHDKLYIHIIRLSRHQALFSTTRVAPRMPKRNMEGQELSCKLCKGFDG
eukprot:c5144_g1_i1 orf=3-167(-)